MKNFKRLFYFSLIALGFASCDIGGDKAPDFGSGPSLTQFTSAEKFAFFNKDAGATYTYDIPVTLIGGNGLALNSDATISYEVDNTSTSAAVVGTNYDFVTPGMKVVLPAGKTFTSIQIKVYSGTLNDQDPPSVTLKMKAVATNGDENVLVSGGLFKTKVVLQAQCSSAVAGTYSLTVTRLTPSAATYVFPTEVVSATSNAAEYLGTSTANFSPTGGPGGIGTINVIPPSNAGFTFNDVCGRFKLKPDQTLASYYTNKVTQTPAQYALSSQSSVVVGGVTKRVLTIQYTVDFAAGPRTYKGVYTQN